MTTAIDTYLNSLSDNIDRLDICCKDIQSLPDLTRFKNLEVLNCSHNELTFMPTLPQNLKILNCSHNELTFMPTLPQNLNILDCSHNKLTFMPTLPQNLNILDCSHNKLTFMPTLPQNLQELYCYSNELTSLPTLPQNLQELNCLNNPIYEIVNNNSLIKIKQNIQILSNLRHLCYCFKLKIKLRKWLWEKVREPKIKKKYSPNYLIENLSDEDDLEKFLNNWK